MKRFCLFCLCLLCLSVWGASAQVVEKVLDIFGADSLSNSKVAVTADSDSVHLSTVKKELAAARLNEANLRMEIEQMKLAAYTADSVKLASQRRRIDSLRHETRGVSGCGRWGYAVLFLCQARRTYSPAACRERGE